MDETHVTRELLEAVANGDLPIQILAQIGLQHMKSRCPACRDEIEAFLGTGRPKASSYLYAFEAALERHRPSLTGEALEAHRDLKKLKILPAIRRGPTILRAKVHYRSEAFIRLLIETSVDSAHKAPSEALDWAELARMAAQHSPRLGDPFELLALATAAMGNAQRAAGRMREAEPLFRSARELVRERSTIDPNSLARIDELEGLFRQDQRQLDQAGKLFSRAATLYHLSGGKTEQNRILLKLAAVHFDRGAIDAALGTVRSALRRIPREPHSRLYLCARYNLARYLVEAGRFADADYLLIEDVPLYENFPEPWTQLRRTWLQGKIAAGLGQLDQAETLFLATRDGFIAQGIGYDAAMVAVEDLALLYLKQSRNDAVKRLAEETSVLFTAQDVHREAMAALLLFQEAARRESLTQRWVGELARYLKEAQRDPSCRFEEERNPLGASPVDPPEA